MVSTGQGVLGNNMFAYCNNNPVNFWDPTGELTQGQIHDLVLEEIVKEKGGKAIILHSQYHAKEFYIKCGFSQQGEIDYEQNKPHAWMRKEV